MIWLAGRDHMQDAVVEGLFRGYFVEGQDVGQKEVLAGIGRQAGLAETTISDFLNGDAGTAEVRLEAARARISGISGVPTFLLDGEVLFSGAMKPELMTGRLQEAIAAGQLREVAPAPLRQKTLPHATR